MSIDNFVKINANKDYICSEFTEVLRDVIRAVAATEDYHGGLHRSVRKMKYVMDLVEECDEEIKWYDLFSTAIENLRPSIEWEHPDWPILCAALSGMSVVTEFTCTDNAARGRQSKRQDIFLSKIKEINQR